MAQYVEAPMYDHRQIEEKWLAFWEEKQLFQDTAHLEPTETAAAVTSRDNTTFSTADKLYLLYAFAYPSGAGLHVGHVEPVTALDILARYYRMKGKQVFFPVGWDAFGLPAENYAVKTGTPPAETTKSAIKTFRNQVKRIGVSYDWANEIATNHPGYYRWTQWLFLQLYNKNLAYQGTGMVNWCPSCQTVLANEQVIDGKCERCGTSVIQKEMKQWFFKITQYRDELISGLDQVDWPTATKQQQLNWIGKSEGVIVTFKFADTTTTNNLTVDCFTTRLDTIFGVTYVVLSPEKAKELKILDRIPSTYKKQVLGYLEKASHKTEEERRVGEKDKNGEDTGLMVINPVSNQHIPVFVADYVLGGYGTGAVMGVPAHDERDLAFAKKHQIIAKAVIAKQSEMVRSYLMGGAGISDQDLLDLDVTIIGREGEHRILDIPLKSIKQYRELIKEKLENGFWNEYIGTSIGFIFKHPDGRIEEFTDIENNIESISQLCAQFSGDDIAKTLDLWGYLSNNQYYSELIFHSDKGILINSQEFNGLESEEAVSEILKRYPDQIRPETTYKLRDWLISRQRYWGAPIPIVYDPDGVPHPVKEEHLPWLLPTDVDFKPTGESPLRSSREFVERTERLYGKGWRPEYDTMDTFVDSSWYYLRYVSARDETVFAQPKQLADWLPVDFYMIGPEHIVLHLLYSRFFTKFLRDEGLLHFDEPFLRMRHQGMILGPDGKKMSKSKGNVINPDEVIGTCGADCLRIYEMFMGPIESDKPWNVTAVMGVYRFLQRMHSIYQTELSAVDSAGLTLDTPRQKLRQKLHATLEKVTLDLPALKFNTAIAALMELLNEWEAARRAVGEQQLLTPDDLSLVSRMIAPLAPFLAEELWTQLPEVIQGELRRVGTEGLSVHLTTWPAVDPELAKPSSVIIPVQINGKIRAKLTISQDVVTEHSLVLEQALAHSDIKKQLSGKSIKKQLYIAGKIVSIVTE